MRLFALAGRIHPSLLFERIGVRATTPMLIQLQVLMATHMHSSATPKLLQSRVDVRSYTVGKPKVAPSGLMPSRITWHMHDMATRNEPTSLVLFWVVNLYCVPR